jgi:ABC-type glycerol-3-phosphate transport system substrate-binding protein
MLRAGAVLTIAVLAMASAAATFASHSVPNVITFWDWGNDGFPDTSDAIEAYKRVGAVWTTILILLSRSNAVICGP